MRRAVSLPLSLMARAASSAGVRVSAGWVSASAFATCSRRIGSIVSSNSLASTWNFSMTNCRIAALTQ